MNTPCDHILGIHDKGWLVHASESNPVMWPADRFTFCPACGERLIPEQPVVEPNTEDFHHPCGGFQGGNCPWHPSCNPLRMTISFIVLMAVLLVLLNHWNLRPSP